MTTTLTRSPDSAAAFLNQMHGATFSQVGVYMLIRAHMALTPDLCMTRAGIHAALRTRTPFAITLVSSAIDYLFETDADGTVFCPGLK